MGVIIRLKFRKKRMKKKEEERSGNTQPYLQPKGELSAKERQNYELHAVPMAKEMGLERF